MHKTVPLKPILHATVTEAIYFSNQNSDTVWFSDHDSEQKIVVVIILLEFWSEKQIASANIALVFIINTQLSEDSVI